MTTFRRKGKARAMKFDEFTNRAELQSFLGDNFLAYKHNDNEVFFLANNLKMGTPTSLYSGTRSYIVYFDDDILPVVVSRQSFENEWEPDHGIVFHGNVSHVQIRNNGF